MSLKDAIAANELYLRHNENPLLKMGIAINKNPPSLITMTNADRIRSMTDEELVKFLENVSNIGCIEIARNCRATCAACMMDWLREPVKEDAE